MRWLFLSIVSAAIFLSWQTILAIYGDALTSEAALVTAIPTELLDSVRGGWDCCVATLPEEEWDFCPDSGPWSHCIGGGISDCAYYPEYPPWGLPAWVCSLGELARSMDHKISKVRTNAPSGTQFKKQGWGFCTTVEVCGLLCGYGAGAWRCPLEDDYFKDSYVPEYPNYDHGLCPPCPLYAWNPSSKALPIARANGLFFRLPPE